MCLFNENAIISECKFTQFFHITQNLHFQFPIIFIIFAPAARTFSAEATALRTQLDDSQPRKATALRTQPDDSQPRKATALRTQPDDSRPRKATALRTQSEAPANSTT